jgi:asparagine synthase (glutamine-hydrolysing)
MCGLAGMISSKSIDGISNQVRLMTSLLSHRGPDDEGIWVEKGVGLGHKRLSIVDLSINGKQPMHSHCGRYVIVYNGEIYNHLDLRKALDTEHVDLKWNGQSDTETLICCILHWGLEEALRRSKGMFALALWDKKEKKLQLARDRMGEKPLYWGWAGSDLIFGSELKALRSHSGFPNKICRSSLSQYLRFMYVPAPLSIHPEIYKLEPGSILSVNMPHPPIASKLPVRPGEKYGSIEIKRYWDLNQVFEQGSQAMIKEKFDAKKMLDITLQKAVKRQMISDVPLGAFLSGGIDSSTIVAMMQTQSNKPINTFTIGFNDVKFDESKYAAAVAKHIGTNHSEIMVTDIDALNVIPEIPNLYDEPFADSSQIPTFLVCRAAQQHVKVALTGDGGDELFAGYNRYLWREKIWKRFAFLPYKVRKTIGFSLNHVPIKFWDILGSAQVLVGSGDKKYLQLGDKVKRMSNRLKTVQSDNDLYRSLISEWMPSDKLLIGANQEPLSLLDDPFPAVILNEPILQMMIQDMRTYLPDDILCKVDRAAMGVSLETRTPFLDPEVIKLATRIPTNMKINNQKTKWILRKVLDDYVPSELIDRPKAGFSIPIGDWLRGPLREWAEQLLSTERIDKEGYFNAFIVNSIWNEHLSGQRDWTTRLWAILMFQAWAEHWKITSE